MATINFPSSPTLNQEYTFQDKTWFWNGTGWQLKTAHRLSDDYMLDRGNHTGVQPIESVEELDAVLAGKLDKSGDSASLNRYDLASGEATDTLDLAVMQVFQIDASEPRSLEFANEPGADRAMTVVIHITGNSVVTWPAGINWDSDSAPELGDNETKVVLFWDGVEWSGFVRVAK